MVGYTFNLCENDTSIVILKQNIKKSVINVVQNKGEKHMNKEMNVNGKSYTIIKLLGKGKGG